MASLFQAGEIYNVQFKLDSRRKTVSLGRCDTRTAKQWVSLIERLLSLRANGKDPDKTSIDLLNELPIKVRKSIIKSGLLATNEPQQHTLSDLCDYMIAMGDGSPSSHRKRLDTKANLIAYFPPFADIRTITPGDTDDFRKWLARAGGRGVSTALAVATVSQRIGIAKRWFKQAVRKRWIEDNPFEDHKRGKEHNPERLEFIPAATVQALIEYSTDDEFKLILALARWGGLRCPSELKNLRWEWVDWLAGLIHVRAPKTTNQGKPIRHVPIFPEIRPHLEKLYHKNQELLEKPEILVFNSVSMDKSCLDGRLDTLCRRLHIVRWDKPWQNLRSTRETELADHFPIQLVCAWIGNSPATAKKHYLQVTKDHVDAALNWSSPASLAVAPKTPAQNPASKSDIRDRFETSNAVVS
jgi:integrase